MKLPAQYFRTGLPFIQTVRINLGTKHTCVGSSSEESIGGKFRVWEARLRLTGEDGPSFGIVFVSTVRVYHDFSTSPGTDPPSRFDTGGSVATEEISLDPTSLGHVGLIRTYLPGMDGCEQNDKHLHVEAYERLDHSEFNFCDGGLWNEKRHWCFWNKDTSRPKSMILRFRR